MDFGALVAAAGWYFHKWVESDGTCYTCLCPVFLDANVLIWCPSQQTFVCELCQ